jgi:hypothetical protein
MSTKKSLLALAAKTAPHTPSRNGRVSAVDRIPGLRADLDKTIKAQNEKPPHQRLGVKQLHALLQECYPAYRVGYMGFWRWVVKHYNYHGQEPA